VIASLDCFIRSGIVALAIRQADYLAGQLTKNQM
jgi:hypothetical protein